MAYTVSLKQFDGPLDLLLSLITEAKIDIKDIFVSQITEQYLEAMRQVDELDMDSASEFLQMAATLVEIKSRSMLPKPPRVEEEDGLSPEERLILQLTEYKRFKEASESMHRLEASAEALMTKLPEEYPLPPPNIEWTGMTLERLAAAFRRALERADAGKNAEKLARRELQREQFTLAGCAARVARRLRKTGRCTFDDLFEGTTTRAEVITMFLAILEMARTNRLHIDQRSTYSEIILTAAEPA